MKKGNSKNSPIVIFNVNVEDLRYKSEDEVVSIGDRLNKSLRISRSRRDAESSKLLEREICYIQRELEMRQRRRKVHSRFISRK